MSSSAWRANDVVAYDAMREAANMVVALVLRRSTDDPAAQAEAASIRREVFAIDGYDRAAVDELRARLDARAAELSGGST